MTGTDTAGETSPVPDPASRHHLLGIKYFVSTSLAPVSSNCLLLGLGGARVEVDERSLFLKLSGPGSHKSWDTPRPSEAVSVRSEVLGVAKLTKNLSIGGVTTTDGVKRLLTFQTDETRLVVTMIFRHHLLGVENFSITPWTGVLVLHTTGNGLSIEHQAGSVCYTRLTDN